MPDYVVNCAAYLNISAETVEGEFKSYLVNAYGPVILAGACNSVGAKFIHISTDYVFDGEKNTPYETDDECNPVNTYGSSKRLGELGVISVSPYTSMIIRTSWLFSEFGNNNFVKKVVKHYASSVDKGEDLFYVEDSVSSPTYAMDLGNFIVGEIIQDKGFQCGVFHFRNSGVASRYDFAKEIVYSYYGPFSKTPVYPTAVHPDNINRPKYSVLSMKDTPIQDPPRHWRDALRECVENLKNM
jgi:dTDP-4-dehydrorhamnose reductase